MPNPRLPGRCQSHFEDENICYRVRAVPRLRKSPPDPSRANTARVVDYTMHRGQRNIDEAICGICAWDDSAMMGFDDKLMPLRPAKPVASRRSRVVVTGFDRKVQLSKRVTPTRIRSCPCAVQSQ